MISASNAIILASLAKDTGNEAEMDAALEVCIHVLEGFVPKTSFDPGKELDKAQAKTPFSKLKET